MTLTLSVQGVLNSHPWSTRAQKFPFYTKVPGFLFFTSYLTLMSLKRISGLPSRTEPTLDLPYFPKLVLGTHFVKNTLKFSSFASLIQVFSKRLKSPQNTYSLHHSRFKSGNEICPYYSSVQERGSMIMPFNQKTTEI